MGEAEGGAAQWPASVRAQVRRQEAKGVPCTEVQSTTVLPVEDLWVSETGRDVWRDPLGTQDFTVRYMRPSKGASRAPSGGHGSGGTDGRQQGEGAAVAMLR